MSDYVLICYTSLIYLLEGYYIGDITLAGKIMNAQSPFIKHVDTDAHYTHHFKNGIERCLQSLAV